MLDPKHEFTAPDRDVKIVRKYNPRHERQIVRVEPDRYELARWDEAIEEVWRGGGRILYVDELTLINPSRQVLRPSLGKAIRTGRSRNMAVWCASQRPKDLPSAVFTESEHFFVFQLTFEPDREKVASFTNWTLLPALESISGHDFVYYNVLQNRGLYVRALTRRPDRGKVAKP